MDNCEPYIPEPYEPCTECPESGDLVQEVPKGHATEKLTKVLDNNFELLACLVDKCSEDSGEGEEFCLCPVYEDPDNPGEYLPVDKTPDGNPIIVADLPEDPVTVVDNGDNTFTVSHIDNQGNVQTFCTSCPPDLITNAVGETIQTDECKFQHDLTLNGDTPCSILPAGTTPYGPTIYKLDTVPDDMIVVVDSGGIATIEMTDCTTPLIGSFDYTICCGDGTESTATVNIEFTPPPVGDIRLEKEFQDVDGNLIGAASSGEVVLIKLEVFADPTSSGPVLLPIKITDLNLSDCFDLSTFAVVSNTDAGSTAAPAGPNVEWDLSAPLNPAGSSQVLIFQVEVSDDKPYIPNLATAVGVADADGNPTSDSAIDSLTSPPAPASEVVVDDSNLNKVSVSPTGSKDCNGALITDFTDFCKTYVFKVSDGVQTMTDVSNIAAPDATTSVGNSLDIALSGGEFTLVEIKVQGGALTFDWSGTDFATLPAADQSAIEAEFTALAASSGAFDYDKRAIDTILKGSDEATNCDYSQTNSVGRSITIAGIPTITGINYLNTFAGLKEEFDVDGSPHMEGAFHVWTDSKVSYEGADATLCPGTESPVNPQLEQLVCKGVKRVKTSSGWFSTGNALGSVGDRITQNLVYNTAASSGAVRGFNSHCPPPHGPALAVTGAQSPNTDTQAPDPNNPQWWRVVEDDWNMNWGLDAANAPADANQNPYNGSFQPTAYTVPNGFYVAEYDLKYVNGMTQENRAVFESPNILSSPAGDRVTNPYAFWGNAFSAGNNANHKRILGQVSLKTHALTSVHTGVPDTYELSLTNGDFKITNQNGVNIINFDYANRPQRLDSDGNIKAYEDPAFFIPPEIMNINSA